MQKKLSVILTFAVMVACRQAKDVDLKMINKSTRRISVVYTNSTGLANYANSIADNIGYQIDDRNVILPDSTLHNMPFDDPDAWHNLIESSKEKKLFVYFFDSDTLEKYNTYRDDTTMVTMGRMRKYIRIVKYSEQYLIDHNWTLTFR